MRQESLQKAMKKWGVTPQLIMWFEESSELSKEVSKWLRGKENVSDIKNEMADVLIILEQMKLIFHISEKDLNDEIESKLKRLEERLEE